MRLGIVAALALLCGVVAGGVGQERGTSQRAVDFAREVRPIFEQTCYECHGADRQRGGLRLDDRASALRGGVSGPVILAGRSEDSALYRRIAGLGEDAQMPLRREKLSLAAIALIRAWIDSGAPWPEEAASRPAPIRKHWAYIKPVRPELPPVRNAAWVRNPIDHFILARIEAEGLRPSPEVPRALLIRRASLDLTGLPPTPDEVAAFVADGAPGAYEKVVDRLLSSPRYGERWARPWLDLARYADTNGYEKDMRRSMWLYRDWVINALNGDMPFDRFTIEQIAGDLLPNATADQKIATGFHRNTMTNEEGGIDPEEFRVAAILDRVDTTGSVWLGSTIGCARCHNHKFDPFTQDEYYSLFAFFNNTEEEIRVAPGGGRFSLGPNLSVPPPKSLSSHRRQLEDRIALVEGILGMSTPEILAQQSRWESDVSKSVVPWNPLVAERVLSVAGARMTILNDGSVLAAGPPADRDTYLMTSRTVASAIRALRVEVLPDESLPNGGFSRDRSGAFVLTGLDVEAAPESRPGDFEAVPLLDAASSSGSFPKGAIDEDPATGWSFAEGHNVEDVHLVAVSRAPFGYDGGTRLRIRLRQESANARQVIGRFRIWITTAGDAAQTVRLPVDIQTILGTAAGMRNPEARKRLEAYYRSISPLLRSMREWLTRLRDQWNELSQPSGFVMKELAEPRKTYVHLRGSFLSRGKEVTPGVPAVLNPLPKDSRTNRLTLARWLVDPENPLTARVTMNRAWMHFFGRGIVETVEDFGSQGQAPSHPELLDWLATEFARQNWSMKAMHRLIVTSATYRQSARVTPSLLEKDPLNRLLARAPRPRLEAEMIRDSALAAAGILSERIGGPSVFPYQPEGIWNLVYSDDKWRLSEGDDRYRRGLYTFWRRTAPYPMFATFDAPSREITCTRRVATNTPLQALDLLNDPVFMDAARGVARRVLAEGLRAEDDRITLAFRLCLARDPSDVERRTMREYLARELARLESEPEKAGEVAFGGDVRPPPGLGNTRFAAWTMAANVLLNLDEFVSRP